MVAEDSQPPPIVYTPRLVAYVLAVAIAGVGAALLTVRAAPGGGELALVTAAVFAMSALGVRIPIRTETVFDANAFVHLGAALALGPAGAVATACAEALGVAVRRRVGWFRTSFNVSSGILSTLIAWAAYTGLRELPISSPVLSYGLAASAAGLVHHAVDTALLSAVLTFATGRPLWPQVRVGLTTGPYHIFYGYAAVSFVELRHLWGVVGLSMALAPVVAVQILLVVLAVRSRAHEAERMEYVEQVRQQSRLVERSYDATLVALTHALDARDKETEGHSRRVVEYTRMLAEQLQMDADEIKVLCHGALLHDIGKIGVPDAILHKPGPLTDEEWEIMRRHPEMGAAMIAEVEYLTDARRTVLHHHERWDGGGYPRGLRGAQIPVGARVFAIADTVDAMTQDRPYRRRCSLDEAREEVLRHRGGQFDPEAVDAFLAISEEDLLAIAALRSRVGVDLLTGPGARSARRVASSEVPVLRRAPIRVA